jgi:hypothetical protein
MLVDDAHLAAVDDADKHVCAAAGYTLKQRSRASTATSPAGRVSAIARSAGAPISQDFTGLKQRRLRNQMHSDPNV